MPSNHLSNDDFFAQLSKLFEERGVKDHGSIFLTQKRMTFRNVAESVLPQESSDSFTDQRIPNPLPILVRATDGKSGKRKESKVKLSTIVEADALEGFFTKYVEVCKSGMVGLKKRDRSRGKKKMKAKKKKLIHPVGFEG